jgi:hypothetical protein
MVEATAVVAEITVEHPLRPAIVKTRIRLRRMIVLMI